jgi:iron complex transport system ATP-binding protein
MVIIVTGDIGAGKTTVCRKVVELARDRGYTCGGILTFKAPDESLTMLDIQTSEREILASTDKDFDGPRTPKYSFSPEGIDFGIRAIENGASSDVLIVDEIGRLELGGEGFAKSLELIKSGRVKNSILVIRKQLLADFLTRLGGNPSIFETTISNRDRLPQEICSFLIGD